MASSNHLDARRSCACWHLYLQLVGAYNCAYRPDLCPRNGNGAAGRHQTCISTLRRLQVLATEAAAARGARGVPDAVVVDTAASTNPTFACHDIGDGCSTIINAAGLVRCCPEMNKFIRYRY